MSNLIDVTENELIIADRQNLINQYIEHGTHRINTLSLNISGTETISSGRIGDFLGLSIGNFNGILKATNGTVSVATLGTDYATAFINLTDTPSSYSGQALKGVRVNSSEDGLEFFSGEGLIEWGEIGGILSDQTDLQDALNLKYDAANFDTDFDTRFGTKSTTDLLEGINLYYTQSRFDTAFGLKTTDNLSEGSTNLYDKTVSLTAGTGISVSGTYPNFTITNTGEANSFVGGNGIDITESPDDTFTFVVNESEISHTSISDIGTNTHTQIDTDLLRLANTSGTNTGDITVTDSAEIDFTLTGQDITASIKNGSIDETKLDTSVNDSLDLADSAIQTELDPVFSNSEAANITATDITNLSNLSGTNTGDQDLSGLLPNSHLTDFVHSDISHTNRSSLDLVSGTNTGDQDLSGLVPYTGATSDIDLGSNNITASNLSGTNTGDQDLSGLVSLDQTTPQSVINGSISVITPTSDYHIATKKYVDDAIVAAIDDSWDGSY